LNEPTGWTMLTERRIDRRRPLGEALQQGGLPGEA